MDVPGIRQALADTVRAAVPELNCYPRIPAMPDVPAFYVLGPDITYDVTFGGTDEAENWVVRLLAPGGDDVDGQALLDAYLSRGSKSVKLAIEGTPGQAQTLGGVCSDLHVQAARNWGLFEHGGLPFPGVELLVRIVADPHA